jgi:hypothetical protein
MDRAAGAHAIPYGMPPVLELRCSDCSYRHQAPDRVLLVAMPEGVDEPLRHPGEAHHAKRLTGLELSQLRHQGRLHLGRPAFCTRCGDVWCYRQPAVTGFIGRSVGFVGNWAQALACHACGAQSLQAFEPSAEPPGSIPIGLILALATIWPPLLLRELWTALPGAFLLACFVVSWRRRTRRARTQCAQIPCPQCGRPGLSVRVWGRS